LPASHRYPAALACPRKTRSTLCAPCSACQFLQVTYHACMRQLYPAWARDTPFLLFPPLSIHFLIFCSFLLSHPFEIDIVRNIIKDYTHLANSGKTIILCWIPSHVNVCGNERPDPAAKSALPLPITNMKLPARELIPCVSKFCLDKWQDIWDCCKGNKLHSI